MGAALEQDQQSSSTWTRIREHLLHPLPEGTHDGVVLILQVIFFRMRILVAPMGPLAGLGAHAPAYSAPARGTRLVSAVDIPSPYNACHRLKSTLVASRQRAKSLDQHGNLFGCIECETLTPDQRILHQSRRLPCPNPLICRSRRRWTCLGGARACGRLLCLLRDSSSAFGPERLARPLT